MKRRPIREEYRRYVTGSYSATAAPPVARQTWVSAQQYDSGDTGVSVHFSYRQETTYPAHTEYTVAQSDEPQFVEYEVMGAVPTNTPVARNQSVSAFDLSDQAVLEAFTLAASPGVQPNGYANGHATDGSCCDACTAPATVGRSQPESSGTLPAVPVAAPKSPAPQSTADVLTALSTLATSASADTSDEADRNFLADMQSILAGASSEETTPAKTPKQVSAQQTRPDEPQPDEARPNAARPNAARPNADAPAADNAHAIFDRIAQSMTYANAYDLGSFDLTQRFDAFDREIAPSPQPKAKTVPRTASPVETPTAYVPSSTDFLRDLDLIGTFPATAPVSKATSEPIPLDPGVGGRSIAPTALTPGDLIISTTQDDRISRAIRAMTGSEVSHMSVYVGNGQVIHATEDGVQQWQLDTLLNASTLAVAYRHPQMTRASESRMIQFLTSALQTPHAFDYWGMVQAAPAQLLASYCDSLPGPLRTACLNQARQFRPGTDENNQFFCSELIFKALQSAGLSISTVQPSWSSPQEVVRLFFDGTLTYVGHLKTF